MKKEPKDKPMYFCCKYEMEREYLLELRYLKLAICKFCLVKHGDKKK